MLQRELIEEHLILQQYAATAIRMLQLSFPQLSHDELAVAVDYSMAKRMKDGDVYIDNNYRHKKINSTVLEIADYILEREPIITASGIMFKKHAETDNPLILLIEEFINNRIYYKKEMFKYPKSSEEFQKYNLLQLLEKLNANALYGVIGAPNSVFYNLYIAEGITTQGKSYTKAMMLAFEAFLANNVLFGSLNEIIHFIDNVISERPERKYKDSDVLDEDIDVADCFMKIMSSCGFNGYYPDEEDLQIVWDILCNVSQEDLNRLFYKNNLFYFMDNASMTNMMRNILQKLESPFMNPNEPPKEIEVELEVMWDLLSEYVYYHYQYIDRMGRLDTMVRKVCIIADTDSSIISLDGWFRYNAEKYASVPMKIKRTLYSPFNVQEFDEFGDAIGIPTALEKIEEEFDFDFLTNETYMSGYKLTKPWVIDPQEGFRYSIINVIAYCLSKMIVDYLKRYCMNSNSVNENKTHCYMIAKNEFLFKKLLIVAQKNYCDIQEIQEGNTIPKNKQFTIMGMPINKSTISDFTKTELQKILYEDILNDPELDQLKVLKKLCMFERKVIDSIRNGGREYFKPVTVKPISTYSDPDRIYGVKAIIAYNELKDDAQEAIDLTARNNIDVVKMKITTKDIPEIAEKYPDKLGAVEKLLSMKIFSKDGINYTALPINENLPEWLLDYVDYTEVINANMKIFPLAQIGITKLNKDSINYTNILSL